MTDGCPHVREQVDPNIPIFNVCYYEAMLDPVDELEVAALHRWIEAISDPDVPVAEELNAHFVR